ncbi:hypothetical protein Dimus_033051 [Dionaea muscipula]
MGRDDGVIQSSILLLQERFRQLQKEKEMREKRELLKMFSEAQEKSNYYYNYTGSLLSTSNVSDSTSTATLVNIASSMQYYDPLKFFFHPELVMPPPAAAAAADHLSLDDNNDHHDHDQLGLSFLPCSQGKNITIGVFGTKANVPLFGRNNNKFDDPAASDVDTSLHL